MLNITEYMSRFLAGLIADNMNRSLFVVIGCSLLTSSTLTTPAASAHLWSLTSLRRSFSSLARCKVLGFVEPTTCTVDGLHSDETMRFVIFNCSSTSSSSPSSSSSPVDFRFLFLFLFLFLVSGIFGVLWGDSGEGDAAMAARFWVYRFLSGYIYFG